MLFIAGIYAAAIAIATLILAASLFLIESEKASSFRRFGFWSTLARCGEGT